MSNLTFSVELLRDFLRDPYGQDATQARAAFDVVMESHSALAEMLHAAIDRQHDAELALSALRHPSGSIEALKMTLRRLAKKHMNGQPLSPAFEQVMDELIAEVRLECARPQLGMVEQTM